MPLIPSALPRELTSSCAAPRPRWVEAVGASRKKLRQPEYLEAIFTGRQRAKLQALLEFALTSAREAIRWGPDEQKRIAERNRKTLATVAAAPERLVLLQRYMTRLARSIERQYRLLRQM